MSLTIFLFYLKNLTKDDEYVVLLDKGEQNVQFVMEDNMAFKILIHDLDEEIANKLVQSYDGQIINARHTYATCKGCFGCWLHTPGYCIMKDKLHRIGAEISHADEVVLISRCVYGGLSPEVKKVWDRCIPAVLPFFSHRDGKMHHTRRYSHEPNIKAVLYGDILAEEKVLAEKIIKGNSVNFCAKSVNVVFALTAQQIPEVISI